MNKVTDFEQVLLSRDPHIRVVTETWLHAEVTDSEIIPPDYKIIRKDRDTRGGGVAIVSKEKLRYNRMPDISGVEISWIRVSIFSIFLIIGVFYRPPSSGNNFVKINDYLSENVHADSRIILLGILICLI